MLFCLHNAMKVSLMRSNYLLHLVKGCVLYLACVSASRQLTVLVPPEEGIRYCTYNVDGLHDLFIDYNAYSDNNIIMIGQVHCTHTRVLGKYASIAEYTSV